MDFLAISLGLGSHNWLGDPQLALISVIAIQYLAMDAVLLPCAAGGDGVPAREDIYEAAHLGQGRFVAALLTLPCQCLTPGDPMIPRPVVSSCCPSCSPLC